MNGNSVPPLLAYAIASQVWVHLEEILSSTIILRRLCGVSPYPLSGSFGSTDLLELQTAGTSVAVFTIFDSTTQQLGNRNYGTSTLVDGENIKAGSQRSPPVKNIFTSKIFRLMVLTQC